MTHMKTLGIIYLLIWHSGLKGLNVFVITFFLQMFFFISGYFYRDSHSNHPFKFFLKRVKSLYIPFVLYCSGFLLLSNFFVEIGIYEERFVLSLSQMVSQFYDILLLKNRQQFAGAMWFVSTLFVTSTLFCFLNYLIVKILRNKWSEHREGVRFLCVVAFFVLAHHLSIHRTFLPARVDIAFMAMFFYYLGYMYNKFEDSVPDNIFVAVAAIIVIYFCKQYGFPAIVRRQYVNLPFLLTCGLAGIYFNLYFAKQITEYFDFKFLRYIGQNSVVILALHFLAFKLGSLLLIYAYDLPFKSLADFPSVKSMKGVWLPYFTSGLLVPLLFAYVFDRLSCTLKPGLAVQLKASKR